MEVVGKFGDMWVGVWEILKVKGGEVVGIEKGDGMMGDVEGVGVVTSE